MTEQKSPPLVFPTPAAGRVWVLSERDGFVDLPAEQLPAALKIDPNLTVIGLGSNAELQKRINECRDSAELSLLMSEAARGKV
jgi:hypothetical protein